MAEFVIASDKPIESYVEFVQEGLVEMSNYNITGVALAGIVEDGKVVCGYHNMSVNDKNLLAAVIRDDAILEVVRVILPRMLEDLDEEDSEDEA